MENRIRNLIIGKRSNLSRSLHKILDDAYIISTDEFLKNKSHHKSIDKNAKINVIINSFFPASFISKKNISSAEKEKLSVKNLENILNNLKKNFKNISKIVYTSSSSVYGDIEHCSEEKRELQPLNLYGKLKLQSENQITEFCSMEEIPFTICRVFNMYGAYDNFSVIHKIINAFNTGKKLSIYNSGKSSRDFIHVDDVSNCYKKLLLVPSPNILNIGTGKKYSIKDLVRLCHSKDIFNFNKDIRIEAASVYADIGLLKKTIQTVKFISVEDYLRKIFDEKSFTNH